MSICTCVDMVGWPTRTNLGIKVACSNFMARTCVAMKFVLVASLLALAAISVSICAEINKNNNIILTLDI